MASLPQTIKASVPCQWIRLWVGSTFKAQIIFRLALAFNFSRAVLCLFYTYAASELARVCGCLGPHLIATVSALSLRLEYLAQPCNLCWWSLCPPCSPASGLSLLPLLTVGTSQWSRSSEPSPSPGSCGFQSSQPASRWQNLHVPQGEDE